MQRLFKHYCAVCWFSPDDGAAAISLSVGLRLFTCSLHPSPFGLGWESAVDFPFDCGPGIHSVNIQNYVWLYVSKFSFRSGRSLGFLP
jgi:hypothetical protein